MSARDGIEILKRDFGLFIQPGFVLTEIGVVAAIAGMGVFLLWIAK